MPKLLNLFPTYRRQRMHFDPGNKYQHDRGHLAQRVNNEGRIVGSRVRHVTWLHTYHQCHVITPFQFHAGYKLGYLWNRSTINLGAKTVKFMLVGGGSKIDHDTLALLSTQLKDALRCMPSPKAREAVIDLSVFDMAMGSRRLVYAREGLDQLVDHFKSMRNKN